MRTLLLVTLLTATAHGAPKKGATVEGITEYRLDNGLRVLLFPDGSKPTVTVNITYFVGSRHEGYGETGMAHLLEHLLFKGTPKHDKIFGLLDARGGKFNGSTWTDRTNYFETLPASDDNLRFALELEADRMINSRVSKEDLASEFSVVRNEFEIGENNPRAVLEERMFQAAYLWHNYGKPTIGSRSDIERVPIENLRAFYKKHYQPDNAMLVVAGRFEPNKALKIIDATFGKIARPRRKLSPTYTVEPAQDGERTVTLRRTGDVQVVGLMYHGVSGAHEDFAAEDALLDILTNKPSGRLYKTLVARGLAANLDGAAYPWVEPGVMQLFADVRAGESVEKVRDLMISTVEGLAKGKIDKDELERWRARALREIELGLTDSERIGVELSEWAALGDWRLKFIYRDRVKALTAEQVQKVAAAYLKPSNRTVGLFLPTKAPDRAPLPEAADVSKLVAEYKGKETLEAGEAFEATPANIEKRTQRFTLANGLKVAFLPKKTRGGSVELMLKVRAGSLDDLKGLTEVARFTRDAVMRGTKRHTYPQLRDELDRLKAELKDDRGMMGGRPGEAVFRVATKRESLPQVVALLAEIVREPSFPAAELETLRKEKLAKLEEVLQEPMMIAFLALAQKARPFPKDDVRHVASLAERVAGLKALTREQVVTFHKRLWGGGGGSLVIVGDFDPAQLKAVAEKELGSWKAERPYQRIDVPYRPAEAADETFKTPDKQMALVGVAHPVELSDEDRDFPALALADFVFGGSMKSRLLERLRQKDGLSYGAFSFVQANAKDKGALFLAGAMCAPQNAVKAMAALLEELGLLVDKGIPDKELAEAKTAFKARLETELASDEHVAMMLEESLEAGRPMTYYDGLLGKIQALKSGEVHAALKKHVKPASLAKVKAGDLQ